MPAAWLLDPVALKWISAAQELSWDLSRVALVLSPLHFGVGGEWDHQLLARRGLTKKARKAKAVIGLLGLVPNLTPPPPTQPAATTCSACSVDKVLVCERADCHPPAPTQMTASEPINRAILRTTL